MEPHGSQHRGRGLQLPRWPLWCCRPGTALITVATDLNGQSPESLAHQPAAPVFMTHLVPDCPRSPPLCCYS